MLLNTQISHEKFPRFLQGVFVSTLRRFGAIDNGKYKKNF